jgi:diguanylate cyclase (GGDEF)-like protein
VAGPSGRQMKIRIPNDIRPIDERQRTRRRMLLAVPVLGLGILALLWAVISMRLSVERDYVYHESATSAAILSTALEQHTIKAIHQVDQISRFIKYEYEKSPDTFEIASTVRQGLVQSDSLIQVAIIGQDGRLVATTSDPHPKPVDLSDREHFRVHLASSSDQLHISKPVLGRVSGHWTLQMTRRLDHHDGSFAGVVVVSEDPSYFTNDFYNNAAIGQHGVIAVVADDGAVLARRTGTLAEGTDSFTATGSYPLSRQISGIFTDPIDGVRRIASFRHLDDYPIGVLVGLSEAEEMADYQHTRRIYLLMATFISVAVIGFFAVSTGLIRQLLGREREMTQLVEQDLLTGLPNRYQTLQILSAEVADASNVGRLALLFIDLDNFKTVNDTLGHNTGDAILQMTAERLGDMVERNSRLTRIGGDEFVLVCKAADIEAYAEQLAERIMEALRRPFDVRGSGFVLHASIGIALFSDPSENEIDLLKKADLAMYSAKDGGKACYRFYSPQLAHRADHVMQWEQQLRVALTEDQLFIVYQPKVDLERRCITGFEALLRWRHPHQGIIAAGDFIPIAESTGLIVPMGEFVLDGACSQLREWQDQGYNALSVAVNISSVQFWRGDILETVSRALRKHGVAAPRLELEITETAMMEYPELVSDKIQALKSLGVRIALDDFGTGYSSLSYLSRFAVDTLKVDRSFVQAIPEDNSVCVMVSAIIGLARSLGLAVVVEGTETEEQVAWLATQGPMEAQGYLFSRPVPVAEVPALLDRYSVCPLRPALSQVAPLGPVPA